MPAGGGGAPPPSRCGEAGIGEVADRAARAPGGLGERMRRAVLRVWEAARALARECRVYGLVFFGSVVEGRAKRGSDVDALLVHDCRRDPEGALARLLPRVVRLKRLPTGEVDAHTQYLDPENGVLLHIIPVEAGRLGERLKLVEGECVWVPLEHPEPEGKSGGREHG